MAAHHRGFKVFLTPPIDTAKAGRGLSGQLHPSISTMTLKASVATPAVAGVLAEVLLEASERVQVVVTSHSADLLDHEAIPLESILAVASEDGETRLAPLDDAGRSMLRDHLFTAGELLRIDQLTPDPALSTPTRLNLFRDEA